MQNIVKCISWRGRRDTITYGAADYVFLRIRSPFTCLDQCQKRLDILSLHPTHHRLRKPSTLSLGSTDLEDVLECVLQQFFFPLRVRKRLSISAQSSFHLRIPLARLSRSLVGTCGVASISRIRNLSFRYVSSASSSVKSCSLSTNGFSDASLRLVRKSCLQSFHVLFKLHYFLCSLLRFGDCDTVEMLGMRSATNGLFSSADKP